MTGHELLALRLRLGLSRVELGRAFGYAGNDVTADTHIRKYEWGLRPIPPTTERLALMFELHGIPDEWLSTEPLPDEAFDTDPSRDL